MRISTVVVCAAICLSGVSGLRAQEQPSIPVEPPTALTQPAVGLDAYGERAIEATLRTTSLAGSPDSPITNTRVVLKNVSQKLFDFVSGDVTFYDSANVRCGEGVVKAGAFAPNELVETDTPGIRITCTPTSWRFMLENLVPRTPASIIADTLTPTANFVIIIDGEEHPIQLGKPMVLTLADRKRTIVVRAAQR